MEFDLLAQLSEDQTELVKCLSEILSHVEGAKRNVRVIFNIGGSENYWTEQRECVALWAMWHIKEEVKYRSGKCPCRQTDVSVSTVIL